MNLELKKAGTSAAELVKTFSQAGPAFSGSMNVLLQSFAQADRSLLSLNSKLKEMKRVLLQSAKFTFAQDAIRFVTSSIQESIRWVQELDSTLNTIQRVSNKTASEMENVYRTIIQGASDLRVAASEYAEASVIFYQQGLGDSEVKKRADITLEAAKAAGQSTETMASQLTAIWNTYQMQGDEMARAASVGAKMGAENAVAFKDIAEAMKVSAAAASQMGVSYNSLAAIIATVGDATQQSASIIGNAYKTIFSRFQQLTTEGTDGEVTLNSVSSKLQSLGIDVLDMSGNLRELDDIILETGTNWDNWTEKQQLAIAELVGGTRQYGQFLALMQNFDTYKENLSLANDEDGSTLVKQYETAIDSIDNLMELSTEKWSQAFAKIFTSDAQKTFYKGVIEIGEQFEGVVDAVGGLQGILTLVGAYLIRQIVPATDRLKLIAVEFKNNINVSSQLQAANAELNQMAKNIQSVHFTGVSRQGTSVAKNDDEAAAAKYDTQKIDMTRQVTEATIRLNSVMQSGTIEQKNQAESLKERLAYQQNIVNTTLDELRTTRQIAAQQTSVINGQRNHLKSLQQGSTATEAQLNSLRGEIKVREGIQQIVIKTSQTIQSSSKGFGDALREMANGLQDLSTNSPQLFQEGVTITPYIEDLRMMSQEYTSGTMSGAQFAESLIQISGNLTAAADAIDISTAAGQRLNAEYRQQAQIMEQVAQRHQLLAEAQNTTGNLMERTQKLFKATGQSVKGFGQQLTTCISSCAMLATTISNLVKQIQDGDVSIGGIVASLAMMAPMIFSTITSIGGLILSMTGLTAAEIFAADGAHKLWTALLTSPLMPIIAAMLALTAAVVGLVAAFQAAYAASPEGQMKAAKKAAEEAAKAYDDVANSVEEVRNALQDLDSSIETIEELERGTAEWRMAIEEANNALIDLLNSQGLLSKENYTIDSDGLMHITDEARQAIEAMQTAQLQAAQISKYSANIAADKAEVRNNASEAGEHFTLMRGSGQSYYDAAGSNSQLSADIAMALAQGLSSGTLTDLGNNEQVVKALDSVGGLLDGERETIARQIAANVDLQTQITDLSQEVARNTEASQILNEQMVESALGDKIDRSGLGEQDSETLTKIMGNELETLTEQLYQDKYKDKGTFGGGITDETVQKKYAEAMGWDVSKTKNKNGNKGEYFDKSGNSLGEIDDDVARRYLARMEALEQLGEDIESYIGTVTDLVNLGNELGSGVADALGSFVGGQGGNFDNLAKGSLDSVKQSVGEFNEEDNTFQFGDITVTEELAKQMGYASVEAYYSAINAAIDSADQWLDLNNLSENMGEGFSRAAEHMQTTLEGMSNQLDFMTAEDLQKLSDFYKGVYELGGSEALDLADELVAAADSVGIGAEEISNIDWTDMTQVDALKLKLEEAGVESTVFVDKIADIQHATYNFDSSKFQEEFSTLQDTLDGLEIGDTISAEDFEAVNAQIEAMGLNANDYFMLMADGTYKLTADAQSFYDLIMNGKREELKNNIDQTKDNISNLSQDFDAGTSVLKNKNLDVMTQSAYNDDGSNTYNATVVQQQLAIIKELNGATEEQYEEWNSVIQAWKNGESDGWMTCEQLQAIADAAQQGIENYEGMESQINVMNAVLEEQYVMLASTAQNFGELTTMLEDGEISATAFTQAFKAMDEAEDFKGLDSKELNDYAKYLQEVAEDSDLVSDGIKDNDKWAQKLAARVMKLNRGIDNLADGFEDWSDVLTNSSEGSKEYADAMDGMKDALSDILDVSTEYISNDFVTEHLDLIKEAATGSEDAINALAMAMSQDILSQAIDVSVGLSDEDIANIWTQFDSLQGLIDGVDLDKEIKVGIGDESMDSLINTLNQIIADSQMTADQANAFLQSMGFEAKFAEETETIPNKVAVTNKRHVVENKVYDPDSKTWSWNEKEYVSVTEEPAEGETVAFAMTTDGSSPKIDSLQYTGGATQLQNYSSSNPGGGSPGSGSGSGSGGSDKSSFKKKDDHEASEKLEERYANIQSSIDKTTRLLERLSDAEDDAWGYKKYKNLRLINQQLGTQGKKLQILLQEAKDYLVQDKSDLQELLAGAGLGEALFNSDNFVMNKENILAQLNAMQAPLDAAVQAAIDAYNAAGEAASNETLEALEAQKDAAELALSNFEKDVRDKVIAALEQVDETAQKVHDTMSELISNIRETMQNWVDMQNMKLELRIEINEQDIRTAEHLVDLWGDIGTKMGWTADKYKEIFNSNASSVDYLLNNATTMQEMIYGLQNGDNTASEWLKNNFGEEAYNKWLDDNGGVPDVVMEQWASSVDELQNVRDTMQDTLRSMMQEWTKYLQLIMEDFDKLSERLQHNQETLDMWSSVLDGMGMSQTVDGAKAMSKLAKATYDTAKKTAHVYKEQAITAREANKDAQDALEGFKNAHGGVNFDVANLTENELIQYQEFLDWVEQSEDAMNEAESSFKSAVTDMVDKMGEVMEAETQRLRAEFFDGINGAFGDWDQMLDIYNGKEEIEELTLSDLTKNYELDKLSTGITDFLEEATNPEALEYGSALLDEINEKLASGEAITQEQLEGYQKQFEVMQAMDAFEEAKNNKNTMRLSRDASGNYSYVYSADQTSDSGEDNVQKLKDAIYEYEKLQEEAIDKYEDAWIETYATIGQLEEEKNSARYQNDEKYRAYIDERLAQEYEKLDFYAEKAQLHYDQLNDMHERCNNEDSALFDAHIDHKLLKFEQGNLALTMGTEDTFDTMESFHNNFVNYMGGPGGYAEQLDTIGGEIVSNTQADIEEVGEGLDFMEGDYTDLASLVEEKADDIMGDNDDIAQSATDLKNTAVDAFDAMTSNIVSNSNTMVERLNAVTAAINAQIEALQKLRAEQLANIEKDEETDPWTDPTPSPQEDDYVPPSTPSQPQEQPEDTFSGRSRYLHYKFTGVAPNRTYYLLNSAGQWEAVGTSKDVSIKYDKTQKKEILQNSSDATIIQALINAGVASQGGQVGWKVYHPSSADAVFSQVGLYTGGLVKEPGTFNLAEKGPELVLNAEDTQKILEAVQLVRQQTEQALAFRDLQTTYKAAQQEMALSAMQAEWLSHQQEALEQQVHIEASFPGVSVAQEIEDALNSLITQAAQYNIKR